MLASSFCWRLKDEQGHAFSKKLVPNRALMHNDTMNPTRPRLSPSAEVIFEVLIREHAPMLRVYLRSLVADPWLADDLFQETAIVAWRRLSDFDRSRPFGPWLRGIARRLALNATGKQPKQALAAIDPEIVETMCAAVDPRSADSFEALAAALRACVDDLPAPSAELVRGHYWGDLPISRMAGGVVRMTERLKKRLQRARAALLACLQQKGWFGMVESGDAA